MTDTPADPRDAVIKPPPATAFAKAGIAATVVTNVRGVVETLTAQQASPQEIVDGIRAESPEIADVLERHAPNRPSEFHLWMGHILVLIQILLAIYAIQRQGAQLSEQDIARIVDAALSEAGQTRGP